MRYRFITKELRPKVAGIEIVGLYLKAVPPSPETHVDRNLRAEERLGQRLCSINWTPGEAGKPIEELEREAVSKEL